MQSAAPANVLAFNDAAGFAAWHARLPAGDPARCHATVLAQARALAAAPLAPATRLELLDAMRTLAAPLQAERARKYLGRPVPLEGEDRLTWEGVIALWQALAAGYDAVAGGSVALAGHAALACQRALRCTGRVMFEHSRVYRKVPGAYWQQLHRLHDFAARAQVAGAVVGDSLERTGGTTTCETEYLAVVLLHLAQPDALSLRQMSAVDRWLEAWAPLVSLVPAPPPSSTIPPVAVAAGERGGMLATEAGVPPAAFLVLDGLSRALRQTAAALRQGGQPAALGLGDMARDECERLVLLLHVQWCAAGTGRMDARTAEGVEVTVASSLAAVHYNLTGRAFRQPGGEITARERHEFDTLGFMAGSTDREMVSQRSAALETWTIVNKSASGFLSMCRNPGEHTRIGHNQLLGLRNPSNRNLYLGTVQRLAVDDDGSIQAGLRLLAVNPQAVSARNPDAFGARAHRYERALLVASDTARKIPESLILLPGWFAPTRTIDLYRDRPERVELRTLLDKGPNFERVTFATH